MGLYPHQDGKKKIGAEKTRLIHRHIGTPKHSRLNKDVAVTSRVTKPTVFFFVFLFFLMWMQAHFQLASWWFRSLEDCLDGTVADLIMPTAEISVLS